LCLIRDHSKPGGSSRPPKGLFFCLATRIASQPPRERNRVSCHHPCRGRPSTGSRKNTPPGAQKKPNTTNSVLWALLMPNIAHKAPAYPQKSSFLALQNAPQPSPRESRYWVCYHHACPGRPSKRATKNGPPGAPKKPRTANFALCALLMPNLAQKAPAYPQ